MNRIRVATRYHCNVIGFTRAEFACARWPGDVSLFLSNHGNLEVISFNILRVLLSLWPVSWIGNIPRKYEDHRGAILSAHALVLEAYPASLRNTLRGCSCSAKVLIRLSYGPVA